MSPLSPATHVAATVEDRFLATVGHIMRRSLGCLPRLEPYIGVGTPQRVRILGRVLVSPRQFMRRQPAPVERGFRAYLTVAAPGERVLIHIGGHTVETVSDRGGYIDVEVDLPAESRLPGGWAQAILETTGTGAMRVMEDVFIVPDDARFGVVSDIDDTTMVTRVPTLALAVWNTLWVRSGSRKAVQGMPQLYRRLAAAHPDEPFIYLSAGAWNTQRVLRRFLSKHGYPVGPLLLTDFGPTRTGWFRSSRDHKQQSLDWLMKFFPQVTWLLVGDDGQLDPVVYAEAAARWPGRVAAIAIRTLTRAQRILVAAVPGRSIIGDDSANLSPIPIVQAHDGHTLAARLAALPGFNTGHV